MISIQEAVLIEIVRVSSLDMAAIYLEDYIQQNGFLNNEAGDIVKKLLKEKVDGV